MPDFAILHVRLRLGRQDCYRIPEENNQKQPIEHIETWGNMMKLGDHKLWLNIKAHIFQQWLTHVIAPPPMIPSITIGCQAARAWSTSSPYFTRAQTRETWYLSSFLWGTCRTKIRKKMASGSWSHRTDPVSTWMALKSSCGFYRISTWMALKSSCGFYRNEPFQFKFRSIIWYQVPKCFK